MGNWLGGARAFAREPKLESRGYTQARYTQKGDEAPLYGIRGEQSRRRESRAYLLRSVSRKRSSRTEWWSWSMLMLGL